MPEYSNMGPNGSGITLQPQPVAGQPVSFNMDMRTTNTGLWAQLTPEASHLAHSSSGLGNMKLIERHLGSPSPAGYDS